MQPIDVSGNFFRFPGYRRATPEEAEAFNKTHGEPGSVTRLEWSIKLAKVWRKDLKTRMRERRVEIARRAGREASLGPSVKWSALMRRAVLVAALIEATHAESAQQAQLSARATPAE